MNRPIKVMLIDDDPGIHESLRAVIEEAGYEFCGALGGREGLRLLDDERPDLLLLDVMMPGMNGFDVCQQMREEGRRIPVIFLTAKNDIVDKSTGFKAGADDYVTKPFDATELILRIEAHIRRHKDTIEFARCTARDGSVTIGDLEVRFDEYQVLVGGRPANLTTKEFEIVAFLATHPGKVFTRSQIQEYIWGEGEVDAHSNSITVFVRKIREKIEDDPASPRLIITKWGVGYYFAE